MSIDHDLETAIECFPWESKDQREGFLNWVQYLRKFGYGVTLPLDPVVTYFIQRDHESHAYWRDLVATQVKDLQDQIVGFQRVTEDQTQAINLLLQHVDKLGKQCENNTAMTTFLMDGLP